MACAEATFYSLVMVSLWSRQWRMISLQVLTMIIGVSSIVSQMPLSTGVKTKELVVVAIELLMEEHGSDSTKNCMEVTGGWGKAAISLLSLTLLLPSLDSSDPDIDIRLTTPPQAWLQFHWHSR
jgi:hypothetical protein